MSTGDEATEVAAAYVRITGLDAVVAAMQRLAASQAQLAAAATQAASAIATALKPLIEAVREIMAETRYRNRAAVGEPVDSNGKSSRLERLRRLADSVLTRLRLFSFGQRQSAPLRMNYVFGLVSAPNAPNGTLVRIPRTGFPALA